MRRYAIDYEAGARRDLRGIRDLRTALEIKAAIEALASTPRPPGVKKLQGSRDRWRVRVGDWRIVYRIEDDRLVVLVVAVAKRDEVYR
jgi:mRNA interferase RelE/StbE